MDEETVEYNLQLEASQMLQALAEVNSKAGSIPEMLKNVQTALDSFSAKFGISFKAAQNNMEDTIRVAAKLRQALENPLIAPTIIQNTDAFALASTPTNPFQSAGIDLKTGLQAMNDQRREGIVLAQQEVKSEAAIAKEINAAKIAEEQKLAVTRQTIMAKQEEQRYVYKNIANIPERDTALASKVNIVGGLTEEEYAANKAAVAQMNLANATDESGKKSDVLGGKINILRTALHLLVASAIFAVINAFQQMFSMAIKGLRELETATYNLTNAERTLSEQGVEITPKGLDETIKKLQKLDPLLSKIQATEVVSRAATLVAPSVGFNAKEIDEFSQAVAVLAVRNKGLGKSFEEVESQVSNAFLSGRVSVGINQLGVKITDQIVKDEALRMGLVKTGDEFDKLTGKMESNIKARAMLSILTQNTSKDLAHLPDFFKTADAKFGIFQARLQDVFTKVGTLLAPILIKFFDVAIKGLEKVAGWLEKNESTLTLMANAAAQLIPIFVGIVNFIMKFVTAIGLGLQLFSYFVGRMSWLIDKVPFLSKLAEKLSFKGIGDSTDTATSSMQEFGTTAMDTASKVEEATAKMKDSLADLAKENKDKLADIQRNYKEKLQDIARDYADKISDINRKTADKRADAEIDLGNKLADINRDTGDKISSAQEDYRQKEIDREKEKNDKLRELRHKFLMDLEDALRERDARAVLKLIRNYQFEKKQAEEANKQKAQQNKQELQQKLQDIEVERQQKIEAARREYADKLKEIELARQRELSEAQTWRQRELRDARIQHQRQLEEQRIYLQRKLRDLADAIAKEYQLTAAGSAAILRLIQSYFGAAGSALSGFGSSLTGSLSGGVSGGSGSSTSTSPYVNQQPGIGSGLYNPYDIRSRGTGFAEGGTLLATRPTTVTFGEKPEIATFTPLGGGANMNKLFSSLGGGKDSGGMVNIALKLSPDLRAEILDSTLDNVAVHLERLSRSEQ
jgi:hypothetical protein